MGGRSPGPAPPTPSLRSAGAGLLPQGLLRIRPRASRRPLLRVLRRLVLSRIPATLIPAPRCLLGRRDLPGIRTFCLFISLMHPQQPLWAPRQRKEGSEERGCSCAGTTRGRQGALWADSRPGSPGAGRCLLLRGCGQTLTFSLFIGKTAVCPLGPGLVQVNAGGAPVCEEIPGGHPVISQEPSRISCVCITAMEPKNNCYHSPTVDPHDTLVTSVSKMSRKFCICSPHILLPAHGLLENDCS